MAFRWKNDLTEKDITPKQLWLNRRQIIAAAGASVVGMPALAQSLEPNTLSDIRSYNNYYEFGTGKEDPAQNANKLDTSNWTIKVDGLVDNPGDYSLDDLLGGLTVEERIYRFR